MAMNQRYTHFDHIALTVPEGVKSGQPVRVGAIAGVAQIDRQPDGTLVPLPELEFGDEAAAAIVSAHVRVVLEVEDVLVGALDVLHLALVAVTSLLIRIWIAMDQPGHAALVGI